MHIAFIHPFLYRYPRGIERFTFNIANACVRRGAKVDLLTWRWPKPIEIDSLSTGVNVHTLPTSRYFAAKAMIPFYVRHLLTHKYDFVWVFFACYGEAEAITFASKFRPIHYGLSLHYPWAQVPHRYKEFSRFDFANKATSIVSVSSFVAQGAREAFGKESVIISNGVDLKYFQKNEERRGADRAALGLKEEDKVLLTIAALEERKGVQHVINSLPRVLQKHPGTKYLILGDGPYRAQLQEQISVMNLSDAVKLAGSTTDVRPYYNSADIFLLLSHGEAAPIAPLEAMAMELPVLTSSHPPFDEFIAAPYGVTIKDDDAGNIAAEINALLKDKELRCEMGKAGRIEIAKNHTWDKTAERYLECVR